MLYAHTMTNICLIYLIHMYMVCDIAAIEIY